MGLFGRAQRPAQGEPLENAVGATSSFTGTIRSDGGVRVEGAFEGTIEVAGNVVVGQDGRVKGDITARNVIVGGVVEGDIDATGQLQILATGRVFGDIDVASVTIDDGGLFQGASRMRGVEPPKLAPPREETPAAAADRPAPAPADEDRTVEATARLAEERTGKVAPTSSSPEAEPESKPKKAPPSPEPEGPLDDDELDLDLDAMGIEPVIPDIVIEDVEAASQSGDASDTQAGAATSRRGRSNRKSGRRAG